MNTFQKCFLTTVFTSICSLSFAAQDYNSSRSNNGSSKADEIQAQVSKLVKQAQQEIVRKINADKAKRAHTDSFFDIHVEVKVTVTSGDMVVRRKGFKVK